MSGKTSLATNSSAVWPMRRWSPVSSAGVKTSPGSGTATRKAPPAVPTCGLDGGVVALLIGPPNSKRMPASRGTLEDARRAHAAADAHGHEPIARLAAFELAQDRGRELSTGAAEGMAQCDGSSIGSDARGV